MCFRKFPVAKVYGEEGGGGVSRFSIEIFLSQCAEIFCRGDYFSVSLLSGIEKMKSKNIFTTYSINLSAEKRLKTLDDG